MDFIVTLLTMSNMLVQWKCTDFELCFELQKSTFCLIKIYLQLKISQYWLITGLFCPYCTTIVTWEQWIILVMLRQNETGLWYSRNLAVIQQNVLCTQIMNRYYTFCGKTSALPSTLNNNDCNSFTLSMPDLNRR